MTNGNNGGEVVVVTGGASGVGLATARRLGAAGFGIMVVDLNSSALQQACEGLREQGIEVVGSVAGDVSDLDTSARTFDAVDGTGKALGGLVNSAGLVTPGRLPDLTTEAWDRIFAVNVRGTFLMMKAAVKRMLPRGRGRIVNVASVDGLVSEPNLAAYCATKGAVVQLTRAAAVDHAREGLRINCVCPGAIDTPFFRGVVDPLPDSAQLVQAVADRHPFGRLLQPDDVAAAIGFLFTDAADAFVGSAMVVDGGLTATWGAVTQ